MRLTRVIGIGAGLAVVAVAATSGVMALDQEGTTTVTAYFDRATGVYPGSDLRILGVKVGSVTSVEPQGQEVRVTLRVDKDIKVPEGAHAVLVAPSLVADRYIQLAPAYTGGATLADGAVLPADGNAAPVEVDQLYASITELSTALGPDGANANGALARLLDTGAENLDGNGKAIGDSIEEFGKATKTLDKSSTDLFDTLSYLQSFTTMLKDNDGEVRSAEQQLDSVTGFLAEDKENLSAALSELATALGQVKTFIEDNRESLKTNVDALVPLTQILVDQRASLAESLDTLPLTAGNLVNAYDPVNRTLDGRANLNELSMGGYFPDQPAATGSTVTDSAATDSGASPLSGLAAVDADRQAELPVLPLPAVGTVYGTPEKSATGTEKSGADGSGTDGSATDGSGTEKKEAGR
ncbi:MCE family protein [Streptomyces sp. NPDC002690]